MSKKKIEFNKEIFKQYAKIAGNHYLKKGKRQRDSH